MSEAQFRALGNGRFAVIGALSFDTVPEVWRQSRVALDEAADAGIDLSGVTEADSAGLALVIEWLRAARANGRRLSFSGVPDKLHALAKISEVEGFLYSSSASSNSSSGYSSSSGTSPS
jgi:phospholipid transport system transporter-binding protein